MELSFPPLFPFLSFSGATTDSILPSIIEKQLLMLSICSYQCISVFKRTILLLFFLSFRWFPLGGSGRRRRWDRMFPVYHKTIVNGKSPPPFQISTVQESFNSSNKVLLFVYFPVRRKLEERQERRTGFVLLITVHDMEPLETGKILLFLFPIP